MAIELAEIIARLSDPAFYPGATGVRVEETHASAVFITGDDVYKLKKPVDFGFLDYSTLERRREMCRLEVELNRRLAPDIYLGVVPLVLAGGQLRLGGDGEIIDYLVHMRRLPDEASLRTLALADAVDDATIDHIARKIASFHLEAARGPEIDRRGTPEAVAGNVEENFEQIQPYIGRTISPESYATIAASARNFLAERRELLEARVAAGLIRDGHGDIRCDHVYLHGGVQIIDCIEFNERLRYGDVVADIGFLAMDLDALNRPDLSDRLIDTYTRETGWDVASVLDFYRSYRAVVRGKVTSFRLDEPGLGTQEAVAITREAQRFFHLAHRYSVGDRGPRLLITCGLSGTGKSTLAAALAEMLPARRIDSDSTRKHLAGLEPTARREEAYGAGIYAPGMSERVYQALLDAASEQLDRGRTVILDATYIRQRDRLAARELARRHGARFAILHLTAPEEVIHERLVARSRDPQRVSDARWETYLAQRDSADPLDGFAPEEVMEIDAARPIPEQTRHVLAQLETAAASG